MSDDHKNPTASAIVQVIRSIYLLVVHHGDKEIGRDEHDGPAKLRRRYAEDGKRMLVQLNRTAHDATIIVKVAVPICITEDDIRIAIRTMLIGKVEETAEVRLNP